MWPLLVQVHLDRDTGSAECPVEEQAVLHGDRSVLGRVDEERRRRVAGDLLLDRQALDQRRRRAGAEQAGP